jgi:predicted lysophospholipase L1 biosynthesis ABC-type transport system permease subunit
MAGLGWPGENPLERRVQLALGDAEPPREIIGVVRDVPTRFNQSGSTPIVYISYLQQPRRYSGPAVGMFAGMSFLMRPTGDPAVVLDAVRRAAAEIAPDRPIDDFGTVQSHMYAQLRERRNYVLALDAFALLALLLAMVGLHGLTTFSVVGRGNEIAIRMALGARAREILAIVVRQPAAIIAAGLAAGAIGAGAAARAIAPQLWNTPRYDVATFAGVTACLLCAAAFACVPAIRRAMGVDPGSRLRAE